VTMRIVSALDLKVLRDVFRMRGQLIAIALVIASGVGVFLGMRATMKSLESARASYFAHQRFADVFVALTRAPEHVAGRLAAIPGVLGVQTRVARDVTLSVPGLTEAATGRLVSLPDRGLPLVNDVHLVSGRMPAPGEKGEVLASEAFFEAHELELGARVGAVIDGKREELKIVGVGLAPEYVYAIGPGQIFPDDRRFGVFWMRRATLAPAFDMEGAFNDAALRIARDANVDDVLARVDEVLERYGGLGAIAGADQQSAFFLANELTQLRTLAVMMPALFLAVAAFLLNVVLGRIIAGQRGDIAALKAFGYRDREVGLHYAKLVAVVVGCGCLLGVGLGGWIGASMTRLYADYYRFPDLPFRMSAADVLEGLGISFVAAALGTWAAIRRTVKLPPAEAMRPEAPPAYRSTLIERIGLADRLPTAWKIVLRELERKPLRAAFSVLGIAMATGLTVVNAFTFDSVGFMLNVQFTLNQHEDVQLTLFEPRAVNAVHDLEHLPGVLHAEPYRNVPVKFRAGARVKNGAIRGFPRDATLTTLLDVDLAEVPLPGEGLVLSRKLAEILDVSTGDTLRVEVLEGDRPELDVKVARIVETYVGTTANMALAALGRALGETESLNGAWLVVDDARLGELHAAVKETPVVAGVVSRELVVRTVRHMLDQSLGTFVTIALGFSLVMAFGVLYNAARITLAERARELSSLRVLGFRRGEVGAILLGELALLVVAAIPLGLAFGRVLAGVLVESPGYDNEQFRLPLVIVPATYATAVLTVLVATAVSGWSAWRMLDRMEIVDVLKARD